MQRNIQLRNEFYLADAINIMLEHHAVMRIEKIETWLDTGTIEATLETNRYFLKRNQDQTKHAIRKDVEIIEPVFIHESAEIECSTIGPYASIGAECKISGSRIEDSIIEAECRINDAALKSSMVGKEAKVQGSGAKESIQLNIGDNSSVILG
jgi:glucose-1-phosphate thymidylyltransferase